MAYVPAKPWVTKPCRLCGREFLAKPHHKVYCSTPCKLRAKGRRRDSNRGGVRPKHYTGDYARRSRQLRAQATPHTRCTRCGLLLQEHPPHKNGTPPTWQAGHVNDSQPDGPLQLEASTCNVTAGASLGGQRTAMAKQARRRTSLTW